MTKITFMVDCPPILDTGWSAYAKGATADLRGAPSLIAAGVARHGWGPEVTAVPIEAQPEPAIPTEDRHRRKVKASKAARALADKHNLVLWSVNGTGKGGSVTLSDIKKLVV